MRDFLSQVDLFTSGEEGYHTFRIPALATTGKGTVLAFCEGRKHSGSDAGKIDLLLTCAAIRSLDSGFKLSSQCFSPLKAKVVFFGYFFQYIRQPFFIFLVLITPPAAAKIFDGVHTLESDRDDS